MKYTTYCFVVSNRSKARTLVQIKYHTNTKLLPVAISDKSRILLRKFDSSSQMNCLRDWREKPTRHTMIYTLLIHYLYLFSISKFVSKWMSLLWQFSITCNIATLRFSHLNTCTEVNNTNISQSSPNKELYLHSRNSYDNSQFLHHGSTQASNNESLATRWIIQSHVHEINNHLRQRTWLITLRSISLKSSEAISNAIQVLL